MIKDEEKKEEKEKESKNDKQFSRCWRAEHKSDLSFIIFIYIDLNKQTNQGLRHVFCPSKRIETVGLAGAKRPSLPPRQRGKFFKNAKS